VVVKRDGIETCVLDTPLHDAVHEELSKIRFTSSKIEVVLMKKVCICALVVQLSFAYVYRSVISGLV
jgi:hypothetical protein